MESAKETTGERLRARLLGRLRVERDGRDLALPQSRKVRALFGYLILSPPPGSSHEAV